MSFGAGSEMYIPPKHFPIHYKEAIWIIAEVNRYLPSIVSQSPVGAAQCVDGYFHGTLFTSQ